MAKSAKSEFLSWVMALGIAIAVAVVIRIVFFAPVQVDGESMMPTLHDGDKIVVNKFAYRIGEPERFDIVVFHATEDSDYIKRVIGVPGDTLEYKDDVLYINGEATPEPYLDEYKAALPEGEQLTEDFSIEDYGVVTIPEGYYFLMGDNRQNSDDSRVFGLVHEDQIIGKASFTYLPVDRIGLVEDYHER